MAFSQAVLGQLSAFRNGGGTKNELDGGLLRLGFCANEVGVIGREESPVVDGELERVCWCGEEV